MLQPAVSIFTPPNNQHITTRRIAMVYELRTYRIPEGKMPNILSRFENITFGLFERHGIEVVGFWTRQMPTNWCISADMKAKQRWKRHGTASAQIPNGLKPKNKPRRMDQLLRKFFRTPSFRLPSHRYNKRLSLPGTNCRNL